MRAVWVVLLVAVSCYDPTYGDATRCGPAGECPRGRSCIGGMCRAADAAIPVTIDAALDEPDAPDGAVLPDARAPADASATDALPTDGPDLVTLTLVKSSSGTGTGTMLADDVASACGGGCVCDEGCTGMAFTFKRGTIVTVSSAPTPGSYFAGTTTSSTCLPLAGACSYTLDSDTTVEARFNTIDANLAFVTDTTFTGALGGLEGADSKCQAEAERFGLTGHYVAFLSTSTADARDRLVLEASPSIRARGFIRLDGKPIADEWTQLAAGALWYAIQYTPSGKLGGLAWTGSDALARKDASGRTCGSWMTGTGQSGNIGEPAGGSLAWSMTLSSCAVPRPLYCIMSEIVTANVQLPVVGAGKYIALSATPWNPASGLSTANAACGTFDGHPLSPLLGTTTATFADQLNPSLVYKRVDGVRVGTGMQLRNDQLETGIWMSTSGLPTSTTVVWTGSAVIDRNPLANQACGTWNSASTTGVHGRPVGTGGTWRNLGTTACDQSSYIYCIEK